MRDSGDANALSVDGAPPSDGPVTFDGPLTLDGQAPDTHDSSPPAKERCEPNCDGTECGDSCATGMPCDTGCCLLNAPAVEVVSQYRTITPVDGTRIAVDQNNVLHYAFVDTQLYYYEKQTLGWVGGAADPSGFANQVGEVVAVFPRLAVTRNGGADVTYVTYRLVPVNASPAIESGRFGVKRGATWSFETLPDLPIALAVEPSGAPLVLTNDNILRRDSTGSWQTIALPAIPETFPSAITADDGGALYVARVPNIPSSVSPSIWMSTRSASGSWSSEMVGAGEAGRLSIVVDAGTVHLGIHASDGVYYARRAKGAWTRHYVTTPGGEVAMAVDDCGSPHFVVLDDSSATRHTRYTRWTARGWRSGDVAPPGCNAGDGIDIALTMNAALVSYFDCPFMLSTIPLR